MAHLVAAGGECVPRCDGIETTRRRPASGARCSHTGFNARRDGFAEGQLCGLNGAYLPFAKDAAERSTKSDPRASIAERYPTRSAYVQRVRGAAEQLRSEGLMLDEDVARALDAAARDPRVQALAP
jgi:Alpha/beta hydrolase domain